MQGLSFLFLTVEWIVRLVMIPVIALRLRPPTALAWIAVISFQPMIGWPLYLLFGDHRLPRRRIAEHAQCRKKIQLDVWPLISKFTVDPQPDGERRTPQPLSVQLGEMPAVRGNELELISETTEVVKRIIKDIEKAESSVHLLFYIWDDDETGIQVANSVLEAAKRGVKCRMLLDAVGSRTFLRNHSEKLREAGISIEPVLPVNLFRRRFHRIDMRNHRKLVVIDGKIAYTGSQNIVNADYGTKHLTWYDLMLRLKGPIVTQLQLVFLTDWYAETKELLEDKSLFPAPEEEGEAVLELIPSGPTYRTQNLHRLIVAMIYRACQKVTITTPYFIPDESLLQAIEVARLRGVEVTLVLPEVSDQKLVSFAARSFYEQLLEYDVDIYLFQPGLLHSKTMTIDDTCALVGTSNMDIRSFALNLEMNLMFFDKEPIEVIEAQQKIYQDQSRRLDRDEWDQRNWTSRCGEAFARLLAPLL